MKKYKIVVERAGTVEELEKEDLILLTFSDTQYLKSEHLSKLDGYEEIEGFNCIWVKRAAVKEGEYGNMFYMSKYPPWNWRKVYRVTVMEKEIQKDEEKDESNKEAMETIQVG